jgi:PPP family 3-phenylpropionic acid transporter
MLSWTVIRASTWLAGPWSMKLFYMLYFGAAGLYFPYVGLYYHAIHLNGAQIGLAASLAPLGGVVLQPLWGLLSDRYGWRKRLLAISLLAASLAAPLVTMAHSFAALLLLIALLAVSLSPAIPLADATTLDWLSARGGSYGGVRIYGSLGFLLSSLAIGSFYRGRGILALFVVYGALLFAAFLTTLAAPRQAAVVAEARGGGIMEVLADRGVVIFLLLAVVGYGTFAAYNTFFPLYLSSLGAGSNIVGLSAGLASLSELPVMAVAGIVVARVGVKPLLLAGLTAAALRWLAYGVLRDYHLVLVWQLLHGLSFAGLYVGGVTFMDRSVPERLRSTGQTIFSGATFGLGAVLGSTLFGLLFDRLHAGGMFLVAGAIALGAIVGVVFLVPNIGAERRPARRTFTSPSG